MWRSDGTPAVDQSEGEYQAQLRWDWTPKWRGYKGTPITAADDFAQPYRAPAADDFAQPYEPTLEELLEELI